MQCSALVFIWRLLSTHHPLKQCCRPTTPSMTVASPSRTMCPRKRAPASEFPRYHSDLASMRHAWPCPNHGGRTSRWVTAMPDVLLWPPWIGFGNVCPEEGCLIRLGSFEFFVMSPPAVLTTAIGECCTWQGDIHMKARTQDFPEENYIVSGWSVLFTSPGMLRQEWKYSPLDEEAWTRPSALLARPRPLHPFHPLRSSPPQSLAPCSRRVTSSRHLFQSTCLPSCPRLGFYSLMANWAVFLQYFSAPSAPSWLSDRLVSQTGRCHQESPVTEWTQCVKMHVRKDRTPPAKMGWSWWMAPCASGGACSGICPVTTGRRVEKADGEEPRKQTHNPNRTPVTNRSLHILCPFGIFFLSL